MQLKTNLCFAAVACAVLIMSAPYIIQAQPAPTNVESTGFFRYPATDGSQLVFCSEGDLWTVPLSGGTAVRLTTHEGNERFPHYSPDGKLIAFSEQDDGQDDVFVVRSAGGEPKRLTFHPESDQVLGWNPKGEIVFRSRREIPYRGYRLYTIPPSGGFPQAMKLDKAALVSFEPDGNRIAFNRYSREFRTWKRYKGGWAQDIWIGDLDKLEFTNLTNQTPDNDWDGTDAFPMWHANGRIYFLSDRAGRSNLFSMTPGGGDVRQHTVHKEFDIRWPSIGGSAIVYQNGMDVWSYNISTDEALRIPIDLPSDRVQARLKLIDPKKYISYYDLSPDGHRVLFCARGEIFTAPTRGKGLIRQLTFMPGSSEKFPLWSPDGGSIAVWSDASGEEKLYNIPAEGGSPTVIGTDDKGWHFPAIWSPDGSKLAFGNEEFELVVMDAKTGRTEVIDHGNWEITDYTWSPDSRFLAYGRQEDNYNQIIRIRDISQKKSHNLTSDLFHSFSPVFSPDGRYIYYLSNTVANPHVDPYEVTYILDKGTAVLAVALKSGTLLPLAPQADPPDHDAQDSESGKDSKEGKSNSDDPPPEVNIDFDGILDRQAPLPIPAGNYTSLNAADDFLFYLSRENEGLLGVGLFEEPSGSALNRFDVRKGKEIIVSEKVDSYDLSHDGKQLLIRQENKFTFCGVDDEPGENAGGNTDKDDDKHVDLTNWSMRVDVKAEWRQMFREAWRLQRDFFWESGMHGVDWNAVYDKYAPLSDRISTRGELNDLIGEMLAELNCSHTYVWGGDRRSAKYHSTGLLGVDVTRHRSGFYRIERVITGRVWNPSAASPLAASGIDAEEGQFIVSINGRSTAEVDNYLELLLDCGGRITSVSLNNRPSLKGSREVIVKPLNRERLLRYFDWVDNRKAYVEEKSAGQIAYIHLTNMGGRGLSQFTRQYQPQHNKPALIMDVRYNGGGWVAEMILSHLHRRPFSFGISRHGLEYRTPWTAYYGHMAAVCNGETGSDGETFTEGFKSLELGPVIGTRTWGGWVGIRGDKPFVDRGMITQPEFTGWGLNGKWMIEGHGTEPDIEVPEDPSLILRGQDPQLDATIEYLLRKLAEDPIMPPPQPAYPDRSR